jgi:hypothetical protein
MARLKLFVTGQGDFGPIKCRLCNKRFRKWHGTANHGLMHVRKGEAIADLEVCSQTDACRYEFYVPDTGSEEGA